MDIGTMKEDNIRVIDTGKRVVRVIDLTPDEWKRSTEAGQKISGDPNWKPVASVEHKIVAPDPTRFERGKANDK